MTKLEAVNIMLQGIQETAIQSLDSGLVDAATAERILDDTTSDILEKGWTVNTERELIIVQNVDGKIAVPANWLRIDTSGASEHLDLVPRMDGSDLRLWDKKEQTFVIGENVTVHIVYDLDFEELPRAYQTYITYCATEKFQKAILGSIVLDKFAKEQKADAWAAMLDAEAEQEDDNVLRDSPSVRAVALRNNPRALE